MMTMWNAKRMRVGAYALVLALGVTACGDDEKDNDPSVDGSAGDGDGDGADGAPSDGEEGDGDAEPEDGEPADGSEGGEPSEEVTACLAESIPGDTNMERITFTGADGLSVGFVRHVRKDSFGTSGSTIWDPDRVAVTDASGSTCVSDLDSLDYKYTHHNFDDVYTALAGDVTYVLSQTQEDYDFPVFFGITKKVRGDVAYGPTALQLVKCTLLNDDSDCTERYSR